MAVMFGFTRQTSEVLTPDKCGAHCFRLADHEVRALDDVCDTCCEHHVSVNEPGMHDGRSRQFAIKRYGSCKERGILF